MDNDCYFITGAAVLGKTLRKRILLTRLHKKMAGFDKITNPRIFEHRIKQTIRDNPALVNKLMEAGQTKNDLLNKLTDHFSHAH